MSPTPADLVRRARHDAQLTQADLARRLGVTQAAVARLERDDANPTFRTLVQAVEATGRRLDLRLAKPKPSVDVTLLREALRLSAGERIAAAERLTADAWLIAGAAGRHLDAT
jgi:transcriptional regulator with XRE-family HTH domain